MTYKKSFKIQAVRAARILEEDGAIEEEEQLAFFYPNFDDLMRLFPYPDKNSSPETYELRTMKWVALMGSHFFLNLPSYRIRCSQTYVNKLLEAKANWDDIQANAWRRISQLIVENQD